MTNRTFGWLSVLGVGLAGCAQQAPAPVVEGYGAPNRVTIAGPVAQPYGSFTERVSRSQRTPMPGAAEMAPLADYAVAPTVREEDLAGISPAAGSTHVGSATQAVQREAVLPKPALLADIGAKPSVEKGLVSYTVQPGDTVYRIARQFNTNPREIVALNQMDGTAGVEVGQVLKVPAGLGRNGTSGLEKQLAQLEKEIAGIEPAAGNAVKPLEAKAEVNAAPEQTAGLRSGRVTAGEEALRDIAVQARGDGVTYVTHKVVAGETVYRISQQYGASVIDVMAANNFNQPQDLQSGMIVKVPVNAATPAKPGPAKTADNGQPTADDIRAAETRVPAKMTAVDEVKAAMHKGRVDAAAAHANGLAWPVKGNILRRFGEAGNGVTHTGINIAVPLNTPVLSTDKGTVLYAGNGLKTYGNLVLVRHADGMVSAYAHNNQLLVKKGETVKKGQVIALSGDTGNVEQPQLHFEIRRAARAVDPLRMLAAR